MRSASAAITSQLAARRSTLANCLWILLRDGTVLGLTDHDRDLTVDMSDISDVPVVYSASTGVFPSDATLETGLNADNFEISGPLTAQFTRAGVLGRRFNQARVRLFKADWSVSFPTIMPILAGNITEARVKGSEFIFEIRSDSGRFKQPVGSVLSPYCDADYGDTRCGAVPVDIAATVTAVTSDITFTTNLGGTYADDYFNLGRVEFLTGSLAGTDPVEVYDYVGASGLTTTLIPLAEAPQIGDTLRIRRGCSKLKSSADVNLPTCASYSNVINFRGADQVPGSDTYLKIPVPGSAGA